jgi:RNA polymerase II subunit A C-terminal domain phosphatase SSU72
MLDRNRRIKEKPERFQDSRERFDVIFTVEERIFDQVIEGKNSNKIKKNLIILLADLENREKRTNEIVHIINIDVIDNPEDATLGAFMLCELGQKVKLKLNIDFSSYSFIVRSNK